MIVRGGRRERKTKNENVTRSDARAASQRSQNGTFLLRTLLGLL